MLESVFIGRLKPERSVSKGPHRLSIRFLRISCFIIIHVSELVKLTYCATPGVDFCYDEPNCDPSSQKWDGVCVYGRMQSPVNLESYKVKRIPKSVSLVLSREYAQLHPFELRNGGQTIVAGFNDGWTSQCLVKGRGFLPDEPWHFVALHFHWGPNDFVGSEHTINGQQFPLELHMIHRQIKDNNKFAVFGVLYQISEYDNVALNPIVNNLYRVRNLTFDQPVRLEYENSINLTALLPSKIKVFRYHGSLTTPPCTESVIWTVFDDIQPVSRRQLMEFRTLLQRPGGKPILTNFRPVQPTFTEQRKAVYYMKTITPSSNIIKRNNG